MSKTPAVGFCTRLGLVVSLLSPALPVVAETAELAAAEDDASCEFFYGYREKIADAKRTRIDSHLFDNLQGKTIRHIQFNTRPVFDEDDPAENNSLYLFLNKLHVNTSPHVIATQLLFKEGDSLDVKRVQESERILRKRAYLTNAYIVPVKVCTEQVDLMVVTQDSWALEPQFSVSKESEGTNSGLAIADGNILGSGNSLTIGYEQTTERNLVSYDFRSPHVFNSQIATRLYYADTSDGRDMIVDVAHPFYSLSTPWSAGFYTQDVTLDQPIRHMDEEINEFSHQSMYNQVYFGKATDVQETHTQRWLIGFANEEDNFFATPETLQPVPENRKSVYSWVEYQYLANRFGVFKNIYQIQRPEDIAIGSNLAVRFGYGGTLFDNPDDVYRLLVDYTYTRDIDARHILESGFNFDGAYHTQLKKGNSRVWGTNLAYHYFEDEKRRWYVGFEYEVGQDLAQHEELTVGDIAGLRGYPSDYQRGDQRYVFTIERRYFSDIHIFNLLRLGAVVFFDMGKAWGLEQYGSSPTLSNVGIGLRFSSSKVKIGNVVHIDLATPTSAKNGLDKYQITIGAQQKF